MSEDRCRRSDVGCQRTEGRGQMSDVGCQRSEGRGWLRHENTRANRQTGQNGKHYDSLRSLSAGGQTGKRKTKGPAHACIDEAFRELSRYRLFYRIQRLENRIPNFIDFTDTLDTDIFRGCRFS